MRTIMAFLLATAVSGLPAVIAADAQEAYPSKPLRLLVGSEPGGTTDLVARVVSAKMSDLPGQRAFVESRPGANPIAADIAARADPDGYTILIIPAGFAINAALGKKLPYDPVKDFKPIVKLADAPNVLLANPAAPVRSIAELIALARAKPGTLNYGSSGDRQVTLTAAGRSGTRTTSMLQP